MAEVIAQADFANAAGPQFVQVQVGMLQEDDLVRRRIRKGGENVVREVAVDRRSLRASWTGIVKANEYRHRPFSGSKLAARGDNS